MKFVDFLSDRTMFENGCQQIKPDVSVILTIFGRTDEELLRSCIESVLEQTYKNYEFIIIDDGSLETQEEIVRNYAEGDPRIVWVRHSHKCNIPALLADEGILLSRAPYLAFFSDDTIWKMEALTLLLEAIETNGPDLVYGNTISAPEGAEGRLWGNDPLTIEFLQTQNTLLKAVVLCHRRVFEQNGLFDPHLLLTSMSEWDMWLRTLNGGSHFKHLNRVLGTKSQETSNPSLDGFWQGVYKTGLAYLQDETRLEERSRALRPGNIHEYDVFDPERVLPYTRSFAEWDVLENSLYKSYMAAHACCSFEPPIRDNRRYEQGFHGYALNGPHPIFRDRKRILMITNRFERAVQDWRQALAQDKNHIVINCNEMDLSAFRPEELDWVIFFDCTREVSLPFLHRCSKRGVPVIYVTVQGTDPLFHDSKNPVRELGLPYLKGDQDKLNEWVNSSHPKSTSPGHLSLGAKKLMERSDQIFALGEIPPHGFTDRLKISPIKFVPNALKEKMIIPAAPDLALYLDRATSLNTQGLAALKAWLEQTPPSSSWKVYCWPESWLPQWETVGRTRIIPTCDSLPTLTQRLENTLLAVPGAILDSFGEYHRMLLEEDLARNGSCLQPIHSGDGPPEGISVEFFAQKVKELRLKFAKQAIGFRQDARWLHLDNIVRGLAVRKHVAEKRNLPRASQVKTLVLVNSQLFGGSEAYGFLLVKALHEIGFDVQPCTPRLDFYSSGSAKMREWLRDRCLPPLMQLEYGKVSLSIFAEDFPEKKMLEYSENLEVFLDQNNIGVVICSGFIGEPLVAPTADRLAYMALFPPWGYSLKGMTFIRNRLDGLFSDSAWAREKWAEWIGPPVECVPSMIEPEYFIIRNKELPFKPVCLAVVGTMIETKRQKEILLAVHRLIEKGHDLHLNYYGLELEIFSDYIRELKDLASRPPLRGCVTFHGYVDDPTEIARENHLIVSASQDESIPQGLIFNQAAGLVPLACPAGGIEEVVQDGETGFLATGFDLDAITETLGRALDQRSDWPRLIEQGRIKLVELCSEEIFSHNIIKIFQEGAAIRLAEGRGLFRGSAPDPVIAFRQTAGNPSQHLRKSHSEVKEALCPAANGIMKDADLSRSMIRYKFKGIDNEFSGLYFQVRTNRTEIQGELTITIKSPSGCLLRKIGMDASFLKDSAWVKLEFQPIENTLNRDFLIEFRAVMKSGRLTINEGSGRDDTQQYRTRLFYRRLQRILKQPRDWPESAIVPIYGG
jgi:glycosyltransferase involved in cell wall biosynthesis